jgi:hypothetical protein
MDTTQYALILEDHILELDQKNRGQAQDIQLLQAMLKKMESGYLQMRLLDTLPNEHIQWLLTVRSQSNTKLSKLLESVL